MVQQIGTQVQQDTLTEKALSKINVEKTNCTYSCTDFVPSSRYSKKTDTSEFCQTVPTVPTTPQNQHLGTAKRDLLKEVSKLFDNLGETSKSTKRYWLQVWLKNKRYPQVQSGKEMSLKQLQELRDDIVEVLNC